MENDSAARWALYTIPPFRHMRENIGQFLKTTEGNGGFLKAEEAKGGGQNGVFDTMQYINVAAHILPARKRLRCYETPVLEDCGVVAFEGVHRKLGSRAAFTSSKRRTGVV